MGSSESIIEIYRKVEDILNMLYLCTKQEQIEEVFSKYEIQSFKERSDLLKKCMGFIETFGTPEETTEEEDYEFDCAVFLEGTWRLSY